MSYVGESANEYGTQVSVFDCEECGQRFSVCPHVPEERRDQWDGCLAEGCASYEPTRDADLYFLLGMVRRDDRP